MSSANERDRGVQGLVAAAAVAGLLATGYKVEDAVVEDALLIEEQESGVGTTWFILVEGGG